MLALRAVLTFALTIAFEAPSMAASSRCIIPFLETSPENQVQQPQDPISLSPEAKRKDAEVKAAEERFLSQTVNAIAAQYAMDRPVSVLIERNLANACAILTYDNRMALLVDYDWVSTYAESNYWIWNGIIAHELGHHVNNHTRETPDKWRMEYEADKFAGRILRFLGANEHEAKLFVGKHPEAGSNTHPPRSVREAAVMEGYKEKSPAASYVDGNRVLDATSSQTRRIKDNLSGKNWAISHWAVSKLTLDASRGDEITVRLLKDYNVDPSKRITRNDLACLLRENFITSENELDIDLATLEASCKRWWR